MRSSPNAAQAEAGAAFWIRIGSGLNRANALAAWRQAFASSKCDVVSRSDTIRIEAMEKDGALAVGATAPFKVASLIEPRPQRVILELDGEDVGQQLLKDIEPIPAFEARRASVPVLQAPKLGGLYWEAESGLANPGMEIRQDASASGGAHVWPPGETGGKGSGSGSVSWRLNVVNPGRYYLWGRVLSPTPEDDSFTVKILDGVREIVGSTTWSLGVHRQWEWVRLNQAAAGLPPRWSCPKASLVSNCSPVKMGRRSTGCS